MVLREIPKISSKFYRQEAARCDVALRKDSLETHCPGAVKIEVGRLNGPLHLDGLRTGLLQSLKGRRPGDTTRVLVPNEGKILFALQGQGAWLEYQGKRLRIDEFPDPEWGEKYAFDERRAPLRYDWLRPLELVILPGTRSLTLVGKDIYGFVDTMKVTLPAVGKE